MALASPHALSPDIPGQSNGHGPASSYMHSNGSTNPYSSNYPLRGKLASPPPSHSNAHPRERSASIGYSETSELEPFDDSASVSEEYLGSHSTGDPQRDGWMAVPEAATSRDRLANASDDTTRGYSADVSPTTSHPGAAEGSKLSSRRLSMKSLKRENTYPPMSDEDVEARKVQENLERWAAEERQRRRAARASRTSSMLGPPGAGSLGRRLSGNFSRKSSISANDNAGVNRKNSLATGSLLRRGSKTSSVSSAESGGSDPRESGDCLGRANGAVGGISRSADLEDVPEVDDAAHYSPRSPRSDKGKGRAMDSSVNANGQYGSSWSSRHPDAPLRDPFDETSSDDFRSSPTLRNNKPTPTARHPIVTPGRAPSISRRSSAPLSTRGSMPSIVATDADAGANADLRNPFRSDEGEKGGAATSRTGSGGYSMNSGRRYGRESSGLRDVEEGDERESNTSPIGNSRSGDDVEARPRKSTSSSRFQEIGIDGEGDAEAEEEKERADRERRRRGNKEEETPRKAWWTDWLCGCGAEPDDDEQAGRTNPME